jgi:hypothetical protein
MIRPARIRRFVRVALMMMLLLVLAVPSVHAKSDSSVARAGDRHVISPQWTAEWWQWVYSLPVSVNPLFDETGEKADSAQPNPKAFYLAGVFNESNTANRSITIPSGMALFGPVLNYQNDNIYYDPPVSVPQLRADAAKTIDTAAVYLELDGQSRLDLVDRVKSPVFDYTLPSEDNIYQFFGTDISGRIKPAISDGYWFYIPPLAPGTHTLRFGGTADNAGTPFTLEIQYSITVE